MIEIEGKNGQIIRQQKNKKLCGSSFINNNSIDHDA